MLVDGCFMETNEKLKELKELVDDEKIKFDDCDHKEPSDPDDFCPVCFVLNIYNNISLEEPYFSEEISNSQIETIEELWEEYCN